MEVMVIYHFWKSDHKDMTQEFLSVFLTKEQTKPLFMQNEALFNKQAHFLHFFCLLLSGATWHMHKWWSNTKKSE